MSYCLNPICEEPQNLDSALSCRACGSCLWLQTRYRAIGLIGQGGFGRTFLAIDEELGEARGAREAGEAREAKRERSVKPNAFSTVFCVIKQFLPHQTLAAKPEAIALFRQEAQRLQELGTHPQIPSLLDFFQKDDQLYLVQAFIDGQNLEQLLAEQGVFTEAAIWQLLDQILPVLTFIHDRQIIHRDIKPANLIWQREGEASRLVLVDFGAAKLVQPGDRLKTGTSIGSAEYVAPEQARGKAVFASDLYSLGVTCIHLLTNLSPFDLVDLSSNEWVWQRYLPTPVSDRLAIILDQLLQNALSKRFQSAEEVVRAIEQPAAISQRSAVSFNSKLSSLSAQSATQNSPQSTPWHCVYTLTGHTACINAVATSPNRSIVASSSEDKTIRFWDWQTGNTAMAVLTHLKPIRTIAFSPDGETIAFGGNDRTIVLTREWNPGNVIHNERLGQHTQAVTSIAFNPTEAILASASRDKTIKLWDLQTRAEICTLNQHRLCVTAIAFSPDGRLLASASADHTVCLWSVSPDRAVQKRYVFADHIGTVQAVAFSPDGQVLATGGDDRTIKLWRTQTGRLLHTLPGHSWTVSALAFTLDGTTLISGSWDSTLKLWALTEPGRPTIVLTGHSDSVNAIALSPDGTTLISGSSDRTLRIWQLSE